MTKLDDLLKEKKKKVQGYIDKATKEETKKTFIILLNELEFLQTKEDLINKTLQVEELLKKSKKEKTKKVFSLLLGELKDVHDKLEPPKENAPIKAIEKQVKTPRMIHPPKPKHWVKVRRKTKHKLDAGAAISNFIDKISEALGDKKEGKKPEEVINEEKQEVDTPKEQVFFETKGQLDEFFQSGFQTSEEGSIAAGESLLEKIKALGMDLYEEFFGDGKKEKDSTQAKKFEEQELMRFDSTPLKKVDAESFFSVKYLRTLAKQLRSAQKNEAYIDEETELSLSTVQLENIRRKARKLYGSDKNLEDFVDKEKRFLFLSKKDMKTNFQIYEASMIGLYANQFCRRISFYLLKNFPIFFKDLYNAMRLANLQILSNTYVNILVFVVMLTWGLSFLFFSLIFMLNMPVFIAVPRAFVIAMLGGGLTFGAMYGYPFLKAKERGASIKTNLPFAITNMAAVSGAGVPPTKMFKLIMDSTEYGAFSGEIKKIVEYIELFGYDLITSIRSVAATTPSEDLKEFLDGMVNTVESGGDITRFLEQKAEEALDSYELERKKYTETVATYSDIYTGILIAAPLFFVSALSLVSLLGGTVGNIEVKTLVLFGTYLAIPLLNIAFIIFLQVTQPEL